MNDDELLQRWLNVAVNLDLGEGSGDVADLMDATEQRVELGVHPRRHAPVEETYMSLLATQYIHSAIWYLLEKEDHPRVSEAVGDLMTALNIIAWPEQASGTCHTDGSPCYCLQGGPKPSP